MKKLSLTIAILAVLLTAGSARADMTYAPFLFGGALDHAGAPISNGTYSMVIDLDGDGWNGQSYLSQALNPNNASGFLWDLDDLLMDVGSITDGDVFPSRTILTSEIPASYNANVDQYYLFWFDKAFNAADSGPGAGVYYGAESLGTVGTNPGDYTPFANGGIAQFQTLGTQVVPEPISTTLALLGGGAMFLRRKLNRA